MTPAGNLTNKRLQEAPRQILAIVRRLLAQELDPNVRLKLETIEELAMRLLGAIERAQIAAGLSPDFADPAGASAETDEVSEEKGEQDVDYKTVGRRLRFVR